MSSPLSSVPSNLTRMQYSDNAGIRSNSYLSTGPDDLTVPILQACVDLLPLIGAHNIHDDIMECRTDQQLRQLASSIHTGLLVPSKWLDCVDLNVHKTLNMFHLVLSRGSTPHVSLSPRFNAEHDVEELAASIEGVCTRTDQTWLKRVCLERDGGRCVVTRSYDVREIMKLPSSERNLHSSCPTEAAHIIPFSLGNSVVGFLSLREQKSLYWPLNSPIKLVESGIQCIAVFPEFALVLHLALKTLMIRLMLWRCGLAFMKCLAVLNFHSSRRYVYHRLQFTIKRILIPLGNGKHLSYKDVSRIRNNS